MADQITRTVCQNWLHWTRETESKSINSSSACLHEPLKDNQYWTANAMFSLWNQWNTAPSRSEDTAWWCKGWAQEALWAGQLLSWQEAVFSEGINMLWRSWSSRHWKHHGTKSPQTKAIQKTSCSLGNPSAQIDAVIKWELLCLIPILYGNQVFSQNGWALKGTQRQGCWNRGFQRPRCTVTGHQGIIKDLTTILQNVTAL